MKATQTVNITEQDRATARRVIRRHACRQFDGLPDSDRVVFVENNAAPWPFERITSFFGIEYLVVPCALVDAACEAAALGRAYGKALRGAR